jgi:FdhE protein
VEAPGFEFILLQAAKPFLERRAQALAGGLGQGEHGGGCPVCGSLPELSYLQGAVGERWLRCSLCATHWRFPRTSCPVCGNQDQEKMGFFFVEGREDQRVDHCAVCGKYLVGLDLRGKDREPVWEVVGLGMIHLDLLAQQRGFSPASALAWNRLA